MLSIAAALLLVQLTPDTDGTMRIEGRCSYGDELVRQAGTATLVTCGQVELNQDGMAFAARGFTPTIRFHGQWDGDELIVSQVVRRGQARPDEAEGRCAIRMNGGEASAIVCTVVASPRSYVVNFIASRI